MKELYNFLDKSKIYVNKEFVNYSNMLKEINVAEKINNVISFDESKGNGTAKNYMPRNFTKLFQSIDRTNQISIYDCEAEKFSKVVFNPDKLSTFSFLPFSRYVNIGGRLIVTGGFEVKGKLSHNTWIFEDYLSLYKSRIGSNNEEPNETGKLKEYNISLQTNAKKLIEKDEFYKNIEPENFFEDSSIQGVRLLKAKEMVSSRAGHSMIATSQSSALAISGTDNNKTCEMFYFDKNEWNEISSLNQSRIDSSVVVFKNFVYVFLGLNFNKQTKKYTFLNTIERINLMNISSSEWEYITPLTSDASILENFSRSLCGICVKGQTGNIIYLCGGQVDKDKYSKDIYEFNFDTNYLSKSEKSMPFETAFLEQNYLYLFNLGLNFDIYGDMLYYNSKADEFNSQFADVK